MPGQFFDPFFPNHRGGSTPQLGGAAFLDPQGQGPSSCRTPPSKIKSFEVRERLPLDFFLNWLIDVFFPLQLIRYLTLLSSGVEGQLSISQLRRKWHYAGPLNPTCQKKKNNLSSTAGEQGTVSQGKSAKPEVSGEQGMASKGLCA